MTRRFNPNCLRSQLNPNRPAHNGDVKALLGLSPKAKLPTEGMPERLIGAIPVWVEPAPAPTVRDTYRGPRRVKSSEHRLLARCPVCDRTMSAGRLHQHSCTKLTYPATPDKDIAASDRVRSYDFPGNVSCYVEGRVTHLAEREGCMRYVIAVDKIVRDGFCTLPTDELTVLPPVNGTPGMFGETRGVQRIA